ncbi:uncharacterized protein LOC129600863 isoform X2 [Paramacrobiotus metropolitanus]|uniref:uncharacterized protein LOC129600863 isoform X2 n=1 Tax=Paramacrobiotus metropolitanus TaxID=2943436 RepID=UPI0024456521|nr:uncharacterized protein LOC129600863 isoform X2 [Paramacrobiotus metropolitanus]
MSNTAGPCRYCHIDKIIMGSFKLDRKYKIYSIWDEMAADLSGPRTALLSDGSNCTPVRRTMTHSVRYILLLLAMLVLVRGAVAVRGVDGCPFGGPNPVLRWRAVEAAETAEDYQTDRVINLSALEDAEPTLPPVPDTVSVPLGGWETFFCEAASPAAAQQIVWRHQNATIHGKVLPHSPIGHHYGQAAAFNNSLLMIHNVQRESGGPVECFRPCHGGGDLCLLRTYHLQPELPKLRAEDVFIPPMRSVSALNGSFSMTCSGRIDCSRTAPVSLFIWKFDGHFVAAPFPLLLDWDISGLLNGSVTFNVSAQGAADPLCASTLTIILKEESAPRKARIDCWLRTEVRQREWFMQKAYVDFAQPLQ